MSFSVWPIKGLNTRYLKEDDSGEECNCRRIGRKKPDRGLAIPPEILTFTFQQLLKPLSVFFLPIPLLERFPFTSCSRNAKGSEGKSLQNCLLEHWKVSRCLFSCDHCKIWDFPSPLVSVTLGHTEKVNLPSRNLDSKKNIQGL